MVSLLQKFDRWDYNGDGELTPSELGEAEQLSGYKTPQIIEFYDTGRNGSINLAEAQAGLKRVDEASSISNTPAN